MAETQPSGAHAESSVGQRLGVGLFGSTTASGHLLITSSLVNSVGNGLYTSGSALYFSVIVGLSARQISLGVGLSAMFGMLAAVPVGRLADRVDPRTANLVNMLVGGVAMALLLFVQSFAEFVVVSALTGVVAGSSQAIRPALVRALAGDDLVSLRAGMVAVANLGIGLGILLGGVALVVDSPLAYRALLLGNALSFLGCAAVSTRLPRTRLVPGRHLPPRRRVVADRPFVVVTSVGAVLSSHTLVLTFALPLWIVHDTSAPRWTYSAALFVNTVLIVVLQLRAGRRVANRSAASRALALSAFAAAVAFWMIGAAQDATTALAIALIGIGALALTAAEIAQSVAGLEFSYGMAPPGRQGEYAGFYSVGTGMARAFAPPLLAVTCLAFGWWGWFGIGVVFAAATFLAPAAVRVALRHDTYVRSSREEAE